jgi:hypothetical protein
MLWRMPADLHHQRIGSMAFSRCPQPATNISATNVFRRPEAAALTALTPKPPKTCETSNMRGRWWFARKTTQYVVDRFLRDLSVIGHERVVRRRSGIANKINEQCIAACLTSHGSGHISAPPRWGAGSRRKPRRSLTTRTATSQAILAAEFYSRGRCALAAMPVHSLCADARRGWTRDGDKETGSRCRPLTS